MPQRRRGCLGRDGITAEAAKNAKNALAAMICRGGAEAQGNAPTATFQPRRTRNAAMEGTKDAVVAMVCRMAQRMPVSRFESLSPPRTDHGSVDWLAQEPGKYGRSRV